MDLLVCSIASPLQLIREIISLNEKLSLNSIVCSLITFASTLVTLSSILSLLLIAIERLILFRYNKHVNKYKFMLVSIILHFISLLIAIMNATLNSIYKSFTHTRCTNENLTFFKINEIINELKPKEFIFVAFKLLFLFFGLLSASIVFYAYFIIYQIIKRKRMAKLKLTSNSIGINYSKLNQGNNSVVNVVLNDINSINNNQKQLSIENRCGSNASTLNDLNVNTNSNLNTSLNTLKSLRHDIKLPESTLPPLQQKIEENEQIYIKHIAPTRRWSVDTNAYRMNQNLFKKSFNRPLRNSIVNSTCMLNSDQKMISTKTEKFLSVHRQSSISLNENKKSLHEEEEKEIKRKCQVKARNGSVVSFHIDTYEKNESIYLQEKSFKIRPSDTIGHISSSSNKSSRNSLRAEVKSDASVTIAAIHTDTTAKTASSSYNNIYNRKKKFKISLNCINNNVVRTPSTASGQLSASSKFNNGSMISFNQVSMYSNRDSPTISHPTTNNNNRKFTFKNFLSGKSCNIETAALRKTLTIILVFYLFWFPYVVVQFTIIFHGKISFVLEHLYLITIAIGFCHSSINPLVYCCTNVEILNSMKTQFKNLMPKRQNSNNQTINKKDKVNKLSETLR